MFKHILLSFALVTILAACSPSLQTSSADSVLVEQLYFGRNAQGVCVVSDSAWEVFVREIVTPRFPKGFSVWSAQGQWLGANGQIEREPSFVLEVVHPESATIETDVGTIIMEYKRRFRQESVMRLVMRGHVTF
jgi:hypothetical protein